MDSRDLRNLSEAWENIVNPEVEQLDEQGGTNRRGQGATSGAAQSQALQSMGQSFKSFADRGGVAGAINRALQSASQRNGNPGRRGQGSTSGATVRPTRPQPAAQPNLKGLTIGPGGFNINNRPVQTTPTRPATPATKPAATAAPAAKPAATAAPAAKPVPAAAPTATPAAPARRSLAQDLADLRAMRAASAMRQAGQKINGKIPTGADVQAAGQSVSDLNKGARQYMKQDVDLFDIIKGHLLDEGATEEEALKIMAVMTEEERNEILEQYTINVADIKGGTKAAKNAAAGMKDKSGNPMYKPGTGVTSDFKLKGV